MSMKIEKDSSLVRTFYFKRNSSGSGMSYSLVPCYSIRHNAYYIYDIYIYIIYIYIYIYQLALLHKILMNILL